jgi:glycosyltransferase involved in cell wall biosynthesis
MKNVQQNSKYFVPSIMYKLNTTESTLHPLVSVLMTSYNREKYISEAISSVLASNYPNFELIIVDDCSKDNTVKIIKEFVVKDTRVRFYQNESNLGDYPNRNKAASYAQGKYLKYVDADDAIYPWGLSILVYCMEKFPNAGWGLCSLAQVHEKLFPIELTPSEIYEYHNFKSSLFHKAPLSAIFKRSVFEEVGGFSGKRQMSDTEMWHLLALRYNVVLMPEGVAWYRSHPDQESAQIRSNIYVRFRYSIANYHFYRDTVEIPISTEKRLFVMRKVRKQIMESILIYLLKFKFGVCYTIFKMLSDKTYDYKKLP